MVGVSPTGSLIQKNCLVHSMELLADLTSFDVIVILIVAAFALRGVWIGFLRQLAAFLALVGSYWLAGRYTPVLAPYVQQYMSNNKLLFLSTFALLFLGSAILFILAGKVLQRVMELSLLGWFDRLLGLFLGMGKGALLTCFLYMILASSLSGSNTLLGQSHMAPLLSQGAELLHRFIVDEELRQEFLPKIPAIPPEMKEEMKQMIRPEHQE